LLLSGFAFSFFSLLFSANIERDAHDRIVAATAAARKEADERLASGVAEVERRAADKIRAAEMRLEEERSRAAQIQIRAGTAAEELRGAEEERASLRRKLADLEGGVRKYVGLAARLRSEASALRGERERFRSEAKAMGRWLQSAARPIVEATRAAVQMGGAKVDLSRYEGGGDVVLWGALRAATVRLETLRRRHEEAVCELGALGGQTRVICAVKGGGDLDCALFNLDGFSVGCSNRI
jgi:hypothetical protein